MANSRTMDAYEEISRNIYVAPARPIIDRAFIDFRCECRAVDKCDEGCTNRDDKIECGRNCVCGNECMNKNFQRGTRFSLNTVESEQGIGLVSNEMIPKGSFIIEFLGEIITNEEMNRRAEIYEAQGKSTHYVMNFGPNLKIDATSKGNLARFISHACNPNAICERWYVNGEIRMGIFCIEDIKAGDKITMHYSLGPRAETPPPCLCQPDCPNFLWEKVEASSGVNTLDSSIADLSDFNNINVCNCHSLFPSF